LTPLLAARGAGRRFGRTIALEPVELEVWDGDAVALVGPNGAGKSTLLSLLAGALEPSMGHIERRKGVRVGWAPQRTAQYGRLSARENLELFARLEGERDAHVTAERLLAEFELPGEPAPSANLSVGNRQRLNLAISLLGSPDVLLLDEPTAALDPAQRARLWERTAALRAAGGAIVFATQNLEEVERVADRVAALRDGRLVFTGTADEYDRLQDESLSA
jgi:ABC-type multidrug transport system ATPase subunit